MEEAHQRQESSSSGTQTKKPLGTAISKNPFENSLVEARLDTLFSDISSSEYSSCKIENEGSLDDESENEESTRSMTRTNGSSANEYSLSQNIAEFKPRSFSENDMLITCKDGRCAEICTFEEPEWLLTNGKYSDHYAVMKQIGKGAFGYVRLSYRRDDGLIVVTKFIKKSQVYNDNWIETPKTGEKICLEVDLLMRLNHPNIVKGLEYFENDKYFQLIMEKWGSGMDLFEFIERDPALDEPLISYLFRQIVSPLLYLKSLNIIHRDIKDENIIINERFHIKLIDFGSAAYLEEGKKFAHFAGTIEYCSPEVLSGKKYSGPELEVWSLGITLCTIICGENPFNTVNEVLNSRFVLFSNYSEDLFCLLSGMLKKNPKERMNLEEISSHRWTNQIVDLEMYSYEDIIPCSNDELSPSKYISEIEGLDQGIQTTSRSFIYENRQTRSAKEHSLYCSNMRGNELHERLHEPNENVKKLDEVVSYSSRTSSSQSSSSYKSSVTIDSSVFWGSRNRRTTSYSSSSDITNASCEKMPSTTSSESKESKSSHICPENENDDLERTLSFSSSSNHSNNSSRSSTYSDIYVASKTMDDSTSSSSSEDKDTDEIFSFCSYSPEISSNISSSSFTSQGTRSANSGSDENTLENTYANIFVVDNEHKE